MLPARGTGQPRSPTRCATWSTPRTPPATTASPPSTASCATPASAGSAHGVAIGLCDVDRNPGPKGKQPPGRCLPEVFRDRLDDVVRFAYDLKVPPTSNQAERDVRPAKTQQKISGRLTSEEATRPRYRIRGYISTAAKHGVDLLAALRDAILGRPWMPPIPAS